MATNGKKTVNFNLDTREEFCVDGDETRIIRLDIHDINLVSRFSDSIPRIKQIETKWAELNENSTGIKEDADSVDLNEITSFTDAYAEIEKEIRNIVDTIFDSAGMCDTILGNVSAFSPINGRFKYEQIIDVLTSLYEDSISAEAKKFNRKKVNEKTKKYIR